MKKIEYFNNKNIIFRQLKELRRKARFSQALLATKMQVLNINIDQQMISRIENNQRLVTDYELAALCKIFKVETSALLKDYNEEVLCRLHVSEIPDRNVRVRTADIEL